MVSTNLIHPKVGQLEYLMFHTSHMYTQFTSCRITCIVAESCHEEHGQRKDDTQSKSGPFMFKKRDGMYIFICIYKTAVLQLHTI